MLYKKHLAQREKKIIKDYLTRMVTEVYALDHLPLRPSDYSCLISRFHNLYGKEIPEQYHQRISAIVEICAELVQGKATRATQAQQLSLKNKIEQNIHAKTIQAEDISFLCRQFNINPRFFVN